jgi:hypothetical protein
MAAVAAYQLQCVAKGFGPPVSQTTLSHLKTSLAASGIDVEDVKFKTQIALRVFQDAELRSLVMETDNEALKRKCHELERAMSPQQ